MEDKDKKKVSGIKELTKLFPYFKSYKVKIIIGILAIFISEISALITGYLSGLGIENIINNNLNGALIAFGIYVLIALFCNTVCIYFKNEFQVTRWRIARKITYDTYKKAMKLPAYALEDLSSGAVINRITNDSSVLVNEVNQMISTIMDLLATLFIFVYIFINSYILGLIIVFTIILFILITNLFANKFKEIEKEKKEINDEYFNTINESIRGIRESRTLGIFGNLKLKVNGVIDKILNISYKSDKLNFINNFINAALTNLYEFLVFLVCILLLKNEMISITFFVAITYYMFRYTSLLRRYNQLVIKYEKMGVSLHRINEILNNELYRDIEYGKLSIDNGNGVIEFNNVTFGYPNEMVVLKDFSVKFEPRKKIAIVGGSGNGKSTIFNLLTRIFDSDIGSITIDGVNIKDISEESLRKNLSIIRQEPFIFNMSILDNFKLVDETITLDRLRKYTKMAYIDDYIMSLSKQYDTILGEGGVNLSGGQKQRLAIARSLMKDAKIILFDEATSALDNESQDYIKKSINELVKTKTIVIVAHRLSTIVDADIIYVMDNGKIVDSGTHEYLINNSKLYKKLYNKENNAVNID